MKNYQITAEITVDLCMAVKAKSYEEAREMFDANIMATISLSDVDEAKFTIYDESISEVDYVQVNHVGS